MKRSTTGPAPVAPLPSPKERRRLREARALSEAQVAAAVGVTPATVRAWETGRTSPRGRRRTAYAKLLGCDGHRPAPPPSVEATGSSPVPPTEPGTGTAPAAPAPKEPASDVPTPKTPTPDVPAPKAPVPEAPTPKTPTPKAPASDVPTPKTPAPETPPPKTPTSEAPLPKTPTSEAPLPKAPALGVPAQDGSVSGTTAPGPVAPVPQLPPALTAEEAYDALYSRTAPELTRQVYLLTGRRKLAREAVGHAFRVAWQRWPEVARDRDPAGWVRAASYEYAMSPWHRMRRTHRRPDALPEDPARRALLDALLGLPPAYRRALLLHDGVGLGLPETAAETEASTSATASRLLNARAAVAERLPGAAKPTEPGGKPALHDRLGALALAEEVPEPPPAPAARAGGERIAELWTRAALCFGALLVGTTAFTLHTAPTQYEQPLAPAERVGGVPPLGGPEKLTPQDLKLQKSLRGELTHGPERLVPRIP